MDSNFEEQYHAESMHHWWNVGRRQIIISIIKKYFLNQNLDNVKILDFGCANGDLLKELLINNFRHCFGIDNSERAVSSCQEKGLKNVMLAKQGPLPFPTNNFDCIIASDVLEHIEDDTMALVEFYRVLKKGGILILFVPAFQFLWSKHDVLNFHYRRYEKKELKKKVEDSHFTIMRVSFWNSILFPILFLVRMLQKIFSPSVKIASSSKRSNKFFFKITNNILIYLLKCENFFILKGGSFSVGSSLFILAKKIL